MNLLRPENNYTMFFFYNEKSFGNSFEVKRLPETSETLAVLPISQIFPTEIGINEYSQKAKRSKPAL